MVSCISSLESVAVRVSMMDRCEFAAVLFLERALSGGMTVDRSGACAFARATTPNVTAMARSARLRRKTADDVDIGMT